MDCPECKELKKAYDTCLNGFVQARLFNWDWKSGGNATTINQCEEPFQDYKACVDTAMHLRVEQRKKK